ncbi:adhesion G protein-coupled receptor E3-like, partial [Clarias magur]
MNITSHVEINASDENGLISYGNGVLNITEYLVSALVRENGTDYSISLQSL